MRAYSQDLRERIVDAVAAGQPMQTAARRFAVNVKTVKRLVVRQQETGTLTPRPIPGMPHRIGTAEEALLVQRITAEPDVTVLENCVWWVEVSGQQVSEATMWRAMHRVGWTHKKSVTATERDETARAAYRATVAQQAADQFVFIDESGTQTNLTRRYGWAPHDQRATEAVPRRRGKNTTLIAALTWDGLQAPWTLEGAMDRQAFDIYITQVLVPTLRPEQIVVLDNLNVHHSPTARAAIEAAGCTLQFLPAYSPDLNPIEQAFSKVKAILRRLKGRTHPALLDALAVATTAVTPADAHGWFAHAGYRLASPPS